MIRISILRLKPRTIWSGMNKISNLPMIRISILRLKHLNEPVLVPSKRTTNDKNLNSEIETKVVEKVMEHGDVLPMIRISILRLKRIVERMHRAQI